jgi:hypothetical protein
VLDRGVAAGCRDSFVNVPHCFPLMPLPGAR